MAEPFSTMRFSPDPHAYMRAMWTRKLLPAVIGMGVCGLIIGGGLDIMSSDLRMLTICPVLMLIVVAATYSKSRRNIFHRANMNSWVTRVIVFNDEDFKIEASNGAESKVPWGLVQHGERRNEFVLLFLGANTPFPIPDTAFATAEDRERFFELVEAHVRWKGSQKLRDPRLLTVGALKPPVV